MVHVLQYGQIELRDQAVHLALNLWKIFYILLPSLTVNSKCFDICQEFVAEKHKQTNNKKRNKHGHSEKSPPQFENVRFKTCLSAEI